MIYLVLLGWIDNIFCKLFNDFVVCYSLSVPINHYPDSMKYGLCNDHDQYYSSAEGEQTQDKILFAWLLLS